jgi:hypothetical protein
MMPGAKPYTLQNTMLHPLARMLPLQREQVQVYRLGEKNPPVGELDGHGPDWEVVSMILNAGSTLQARVNLQRDYTLMALTVSSSSNVNGGFRAQLYDTKKQRRLADRGVQMALMAGQPTAAAPPSGPFFLREPYKFDQPDSQILVLAQNLEVVTNTIQIVLYGVVLRFNEESLTAVEFPGGPVSSAVSGG